MMCYQLIRKLAQKPCCPITINHVSIVNRAMCPMHFGYRHNVVTNAVALIPPSAMRFWPMQRDLGSFVAASWVCMTSGAIPFLFHAFLLCGIADALTIISKRGYY